MDKNKNDIPDRIDAILRYVAGYIFVGCVVYGAITGNLSTTAIVTLSTLGAALIGGKQIARMLLKKGKGGVS